MDIKEGYAPVPRNRLLKQLKTMNIIIAIKILCRRSNKLQTTKGLLQRPLQLYGQKVQGGIY